MKEKREGNAKKGGRERERIERNKAQKEREKMREWSRTKNRLKNGGRKK